MAFFFGFRFLRFSRNVRLRDTVFCQMTSDQSADKFADAYPEASREIKEQLNGDDKLVADISLGDLKVKT